jgi:hypothetical protein
MILFISIFNFKDSEMSTLTHLNNRKLLKWMFISGLIFVALDFLIFHFLYQGLVRYYGLERSAGVLCIGHSHTVLGIDAQVLEQGLGRGVIKYAVAGANLKDRLWMIKHALSLHPEIKTIVFDVDARLFDSGGLSSASYNLFLPFIGDPVMAEYLISEAPRQEYVVAKLIRASRFRDQTLNMAIKGILGRPERKKTGSINLDQYKGYLEREAKRTIRVDDNALKQFHEIVDLVSSRGISLVLIYIPVIDRLNDQDRAMHDRVVRIYEQVARNQPLVSFLNYNLNLEHDHSLFYDPRHLNEKGNGLITKRLQQDLAPILSK